MNLEIALSASADAWKTVQRAEELGVGRVWFYDTQLLCADPFVAMAAAAVKTERIRLGTGVLIPSNRLAPVTANALASLNALAPGRIDFGIGTGFTARRTMGLGAMRLSEMIEYVRVVRGMLAGETVEWTFDGEPRTIRFLNPELGLVDVESPVRLHVSAFGPKGRRLTAEQADGWLTFYLGQEAVLEQVRDVLESCEEVGRKPATLGKTVFALGCVLRDGEDVDSGRARAQAGPIVATLFHNFAEARERGSIASLPEDLRRLVEKYSREVYEPYQPAEARYLSLHRGHLMFVKPEEEPFVTGELIRALSLTGSPDDVRDRIRGLAHAGVSDLAIQLVPGHEDALDDWVRLFDEL